MSIALIFWHLALPGVLLQCMVKLRITDKKVAQSRGHVLFIGLNTEIRNTYYLSEISISRAALIFGI